MRRSSRCSPTAATCELEQRRFFPTRARREVEKVMVKQFPDIFNVDFTSAMEGELDKVEEGELGWQKVLEGFLRAVRRSAQARSTRRRSSPRRTICRRSTTLRCPDCGGKLEPRGGFFGPFLACENHPKTCKYTRPLKGEKAKPVMTEHMCHVCGAADGHSSGAQRRVPRLQHVPEVPRHALDADGRVLPEGRRRARRAPLEEARHGVLRAARTRTCDFVAWNKPVAEKCPECGYVGAEMKFTKARGDFRKCLKCGNEWEVVVPRARAGGRGRVTVALTAISVVRGRPRRQRGRLAARRARPRRRAPRDARRARHRGAQDRPARRARLLATPSRAPRRRTRTGCSRPRCALLGSVILEGGRRGARARRQRAHRRSRRLRARGAVDRVDVASAHRDRRVERSRRFRRRRSSRPGRSPPTRSPSAIRARLGVDALAFYDAIAPIVALRLDRSRRRLPRVALRQGDDGGASATRARISTARSRASSTKRSSTRSSPPTVHGARVRRGAVLRGLHARRGDGDARARDAALRADEAGRPARSAHGARSVRHRAAAHGRSRRTDVESRRLSDAAAHSGTAARVPHDSRARER